MRYEIVAHKQKDTVYKKTYNPVKAQITEWELRMKGYTTKIIINEK